MKRCPKCGATSSDEEAFCEGDGQRLVAESIASATTSGAAPATCPSCGAADSDDGDGYCSSCGHRVGGARSTPPLVPVGAKIGGGEVVAARAPDEFVVRGQDGQEITVMVGSEADVARERGVIVRLAGAVPFPRLLDHGSDARHGSYLALSGLPVGARRLVEVGHSLALADALALLQSALDLAERVEQAGFMWEPEPEDFHIDGAAILPARIRGARPIVIGDGARLDAKRVLEAVGSTMVPRPSVLGPPRLLRLVVPHRLVQPAMRTIEHCRAELDAVAKELALPADASPRVSGLCDAGLRRDHNEDAFAIESGVTNGEAWTVMVVCDGVSSSTNADQASRIASRTTKDALAHFARSGDIAFEAATSAMSQAIRAAHLAVCTHGIEHAESEPPGTTIVAGLVYRHRLTVGWVGDSRAYWVSASGAELLTRDHSWANETIARGEMSESEAMAAPLAHALTKCLGPLEVDDQVMEIEPEVRGRDLPGAGHIVLCTDGLWNYFSQASDVAALVKESGAFDHDAPPAKVARYLVNHALARGGQDNVTVAVFEHG